MSLIPAIFSNWWEDLDYPHSIFDQNFGLGLRPNQLAVPSLFDVARSRCPIYRRPWQLSRHDDLLNLEKGASTVKADKDKFEAILDVQLFKPEEIDVKVVDKCVVVNAKHKEKLDEHGYISREFTRRYLIPEQCDINAVTSKLSSDGILTITAPRKKELTSTNEKVIEIKHTGKPALKNESCESKTDKK